MSDKNGGQAFPKMSASFNPASGTVAFGADGGMTLRDYFAAKAMQGILASDSEGSYDDHVANAFYMADLMLEARK